MLFMCNQCLLRSYSIGFELLNHILVGANALFGDNEFYQDFDQPSFGKL